MNIHPNILTHKLLHSYTFTLQFGIRFGPEKLINELRSAYFPAAVCSELPARSLLPIAHRSYGCTCVCTRYNCHAPIPSMAMLPRASTTRWTKGQTANRCGFAVSFVLPFGQQLLSTRIHPHSCGQKWNISHNNWCSSPLLFSRNASN